MDTIVCKVIYRHEFWSYRWVSHTYLVPANGTRMHLGCRLSWTRKGAIRGAERVRTSYVKRHNPIEWIQL